MKNTTIAISIALSGLFFSHAYANETSDLKAINEVILKYEKSVDDYNVNPGLAKDVWVTSDKASFIHPRGHEKGWKNINANFYGKTMGETFYNRKLETVGKPEIQIYGDTAIIEFYWDFHATFKSDNSPAETKGRETQVMVKENNHWKIVHVHYSNMPVTAAKQGF